MRKPVFLCRIWLDTLKTGFLMRRLKYLYESIFQTGRMAKRADPSQALYELSGQGLYCFHLCLHLSEVLLYGKIALC